MTRLQTRLASDDIDLLVLAPGANMRWLTGLAPHADERPLLMFVTTQAAGFLMPTLEAETVRDHTTHPLFEWLDGEGPGAALRDLLAHVGVERGARVALDDGMRADHAELVMAAIPGARRSFARETIGALRMCKGAAAQDALRRNAALADAAMQAAWARMTPETTERDAAAIVRSHFADAGAEPLFAIVAAGAHGAMPHHQPGDAPIGRGRPLVMDIGARFDGYVSDITRAACIGPPPDGYAEIRGIVDEAVRAALDAVRIGGRIADVDRAARSVIERAGYGAQFLHRTGHGLGTEVHEEPYVTAVADGVLEAGMVFTIEPGIYLPGRFGIRLEEVVIVGESGPEVLSTLPRDLHVIA